MISSIVYCAAYHPAVARAAGDAISSGCTLEENLQHLADVLAGHGGYASDVTAGPCETGDQTRLDWIERVDRHDRDVARGAFCRKRRLGRTGDNEVHREVDELASEHGKALG